MPTKIIKQQDDFSCVSCVAAMITKTSPGSFKKFAEKEPPFTDLDLLRFLLSHGLAMGVGFYNKPDVKITSDSKLAIELCVSDFPAYVVVKSQRFEGKNHAIFWDGKEVFDPNPEVKGNGLPLEKYDIIFWFPIYEIEKRRLPKIKEEG